MDSVVSRHGDLKQQQQQQQQNFIQEIILFKIFFTPRQLA